MRRRALLGGGIDYSKRYFTIVSLADDNVIGFKLSTSVLGNFYISISTDGGNTWTSKKSSTLGATLATLNRGDRIIAKFDNSGSPYGGNNYYHYFTSTGNFSVEGNILSLQYGDVFIDKTSIRQYGAKGIFYNCTYLVDAKNLVLPATTLGTYCYQNMFRGCTSLTSAPELPAETLAANCYQYMFQGCTALTKAPELPATTLKNYCYDSMFYGCTALTSAPELPATTLANSCYHRMFYGCRNLTSAPELPATTLKNECYHSMFYVCTSLTSAPELPVTTLADSCYHSMFYGCRNLTSAPELPATTLANGCYAYMFYGCSALTSAPELPATTLANSCYAYMFSGCTSLTTAPELPVTTLANYCYQEMFRGCTSLTTAPELPAETLVSYCYRQMFYGCSNLSYIKCLATDISATSCTQNWLSSVAASGTFIKADNTPWTTGSSGIPKNWIVEDYYEKQYLTITSYGDSNSIYFKASSSSLLKTISVSTDNGDTWVEKTSSTTGTLLATLDAGESLLVKGTESAYANSSYYNSFSSSSSFYVSGNAMSLLYGDNYIGQTSLSNSYALKGLFNSCTYLTDASRLILPATTLAQYCYNQMFYSCKSLTTAPVLPAKTLVSYCYQSMFYSCTSLTTAPALPATTLASNCYRYMFYFCSKLTTAPELPATTLASNCYESMFEGCTSLTTAPALPATTLKSYCYRSMFSNCIMLTTAPVLPAKTLASNCYEYMFKTCFRLNYIKAMFTTTPSTSYTNSWVSGVVGSGTFVKNSSATWDVTGVNGVPSGWTVQTASS